MNPQVIPSTSTKPEQTGSGTVPHSGRFPKIVVDWARNIIAKEERRLAVIRRSEAIERQLEHNTREILRELGLPEDAYPAPYTAAGLFRLARVLDVPVTRFVAGTEEVGR